MEKRRLGRTDLEPSVLGLGCQSLGGGLYYRNKRESVALVQEAVDSGVTFFDTADHYSRGLSESWLGEALRGRRQQVVLGTKIGSYYGPLGGAATALRSVLRLVQPFLARFKLIFHNLRAKQRRKDFSDAYLARAIEGSLRRLRTDCIDLLQLHKPSAEQIRSAPWRGLIRRLQQEGKIRYFGISCASLEAAWLCLEDPDIHTVQIGINLLDQEALPAFLPQAQQHGLGVIARNPRAQGHLTRTFSDIMAETYAQDWREFEQRKRHAQRFQFLLRPDRTLAQAALQFVLQLPGIATAIPRAVTREQLRENLGALHSAPLNASELAHIAAIKPNPEGEA